MTGGKPDLAIVRRHLAALREARAHLLKHAGTTAAQLRANADLRWTVERGLQLCVQNALDIATHIATAAGLDSPDYTTAIDRLAELGVLPEEFARRIRPLAGFRNVLVHGYLAVDAAVVERVMSEGLRELESFAVHVERHIEAL